MGGGGGQRPMMDPTLLDGPMLPEEFAASASLDSKQEERYATLYQNLMSNTRSDRDALKAAREKRRAQMSSGGQVDREAMRAERERLRPLYDNLQRQTESFDKALKEFLKPEQLKAYNDWKERKREEMRAQFGGGQGRRP
jgi:Spy/CpxP family protein refolding chaperone